MADGVFGRLTHTGFGDEADWSALTYWFEEQRRLYTDTIETLLGGQPDG